MINSGTDVPLIYAPVVKLVYTMVLGAVTSV